MAEHNIGSEGNRTQVDRAQNLRRKWETPMVILGKSDDTMAINPTVSDVTDFFGGASTRYNVFS